MKKQMKITLCIVLLITSLLIFHLQIFVLEAPDGIFGFLLCLFSIYLILGSTIYLCKFSEKFKNTLFEILDLLFFIR